MSGSMRTGPAAHDPEFRGIDPAALGHLLKQMNSANRAIQGWLNAHPPPPGVPATGYQRAQDVSVWVTEQLSMLTRRYNYAITHPDPGGGPSTPAPMPSRPKTPRTGGQGTGGGVGSVAPPKRPPKTPRTTPKGAGDIGHFPDRRTAEKAARADAIAVNRALKEHKPIPPDVWKRLKANADDPDYTETLIDRLGPGGIADLIKRAAGNEARLHVIQKALGTASHHLNMNAAWIKALLAEADLNGTRAVTIDLLLHADMSARTRAALAKLGLLPHVPTVPRKDAEPWHVPPPAHVPRHIPG